MIDISRAVSRFFSTIAAYATSICSKFLIPPKTVKQKKVNGVLNAPRQKKTIHNVPLLSKIKAQCLPVNYGYYHYYRYY